MRKDCDKKVATVRPNEDDDPTETLAFFIR